MVRLMAQSYSEIYQKFRFFMKLSDHFDKNQKKYLHKKLETMNTS